jgi:hypothetical protein
MDRNDKDQMAKIICYGIGCIFAYWLLMWLLPYLALAFALYAFGYLIFESNRNNRRNRH